VNISRLVTAVQRNCDIADARYGGDDTLCIYLLKMRDYYRWEVGESPDSVIDRQALGDWISQKEMQWDELEEDNYDAIPVGDQTFDRFDNESINRLINPVGWVYGGGLGRRSQPVFFLGKLVDVERTERFDIFVSGDELARTLSAPPAMSRQKSIHIRKDALRRYLAGLVEDWNWRKQDNAMAKVISGYGFNTDSQSALNRLVENETENLILHEIGERVAEELIGEGWQSMVLGIENPVLELKARAVRDNLADCVSSLPAFLSLDDQMSLDFFYANMTGLRKELFPSFCKAYWQAKREGNYRAISAVVREGKKHWLKVSRQLITEAARRTTPRSYRRNVEQCLSRCTF